MFSITKYEHEFLEKEKQFIKIYFRYDGVEEKNIKIKLYENLTNERWQVIGDVLKVIKNSNYWVSSVYEWKFECMYNNDIIVKFFDSDTNEILYEKKIITSKVNINKRSLGGDFSKKNTWIIGDSHTNHFFSYDISYDLKNFETNSTVINPLSLPLLSINRFINSDYLKLFRNLPIFDGDDICLFFGEIDTRVGIIRNSKLKNITYSEHIMNLVDRFIRVLKIIQNEYKECNFYYILPNPPVKDGWIVSEKKEVAFQGSSQKERFVVRYIFEDIIVSELKKINIKPINLYQNYLGVDGFTDESFLIEDDHHFKVPNNFLNLLKNNFN